MKSLFEAEASQEILDRIEKLAEKAPAKWGKMSVNQMLVHCQKPIELSLGESTIKKPNFVKKFLFKIISPALYNDKPWKEGLPTAQEYVITDSYSFDDEKKKLKSKIEKMSNSKAYFEPSKNHPYFGKFSADQWGKSAYKHLDHHLTQFGV